MLLTAGAVVGTSLVAMQGAGGASTTGTLPSSLSEFAHCPIGDKAVTACMWASTGGTFVVGKASLTLPSPAVLTLGLVSHPSGALTAVDPTDGTLPLAAPTTDVTPVPGLTVGATPALSALPTLSISHLLAGKGKAVTLPLVVTLSNTLLGSDCTLGTAAAPLTVNLTDGTSAPPKGTAPITGAKGTLSSTNSGVITIKNVKLVGNAFAAPGASNCGPAGVEDSLVDGLEGLPSAAGSNSAVLSGTIKTAPASLIRKYLG